MGANSFMRLDDPVYGKDIQAVGVATDSYAALWKLSTLPGI